MSEPNMLHAKWLVFLPKLDRLSVWFMWINIIVMACYMYRYWSILIVTLIIIGFHVSVSEATLVSMGKYNTWIH